MQRTEKPQGKFRPTRWSVVLRSQGQGEEARNAMEELCRTYWVPLYAWSRQSGIATADAEDYVQSFFLQVVSKELFSVADESRGKLRTFLLTSYRRHIKDEREKQHAVRRGGGKVFSFDAMEAEEWLSQETDSEDSPERIFDRQWALTVLDNALARVERHAAARGRGEDFEKLRPFLTTSADASILDDLASALKMTPGAAKVALHRLRRRFRDALREEVRETQDEEEDVDQEMGYLLSVLQP